MPTKRDRIPRELDWDLWLGPAKMRDYNDAYLPFKWRGFWDFGTGALGDMGCHIMETPFSVLDLGYLGMIFLHTKRVYTRHGFNFVNLICVFY